MVLEETHYISLLLRHFNHPLIAIHESRMRIFHNGGFPITTYSPPIISFCPQRVMVYKEHNKLGGKLV
jgi:hypothetical protein